MASCRKIINLLNQYSQNFLKKLMLACFCQIVTNFIFCLFLLYLICFLDHLGTFHTIKHESYLSYETYLSYDSLKKSTPNST